MRIHSIFLVSLVVAVQFVYAEKPQAKNDAFTIHPILSISILGIHASYEGALGASRWAYEVPVYFGYSERVYANPTMFLGSGIGIRRYVSTAGQGAYFEPALELLNKHQFASGGDSLNNILFIMPSMRMGYKLRWKTVVLDLGLGSGFLYGALTDGTAAQNDGWIRALIPTGNIAIGVPF